MPTRSRFVPLVVLIIGVLVGVYALAGYAMSGSATVSNPEQRPSPRAAAIAYLGTAAAAIAAAGAAAVALVRRSRG